MVAYRSRRVVRSEDTGGVFPRSLVARTDGSSSMTVAAQIFTLRSRLKTHPFRSAAFGGGGGGAQLSGSCSFETFWSLILRSNDFPLTHFCQDRAELRGLPGSFA